MTIWTRLISILDRPFGCRWLLAVHFNRSSADLVHEDELSCTEEINREHLAFLLPGQLMQLQKWTDGRSKLLRELLSSMQIIKVFTYEVPFLKRGADTQMNGDRRS